MKKNKCTQCLKTINRKIHQKTVNPFCNSICYGQWQIGKKFKQQGKSSRKTRYCSFEQCKNIHFGHGYCRKHYLQMVYTRPKIPNKTKKATINCSNCGIGFIAYHINAKFCSMKCSSVFRKKDFIIKKGYKKLLIADHPRADSKGYVFEHIVIAEKIIGRPLFKDEEIHHKDFNRQNNAPSNLIVCKSHSEHMKYHARLPSGVIE